MPNCFAVASSFFRLLFIFLSQYIVRRFCSGFCSYMHTFLDGINLTGRSSGHATYPSKKATASCTVHRFLYLDRVQCSVASIRIGIVQASARGEQGCRPPLLSGDKILYCILIQAPFGLNIPGNAPKLGMFQTQLERLETAVRWF